MNNFYFSVGDIIKATLGKARENNKVNCAKSMAESLIIKFKEIRQLQDNESVINRQTVEFHSLKELAKRFALSFGLDEQTPFPLCRIEAGAQCSSPASP